MLNVLQENKELLESILRPDDVLHWYVATLPILCICKKQGNNPEKFKVFLIEKKSLYADHTIDDASLNEQLEDCFVLKMMPIHDKDENTINCASSCIGSQ